MLLTSSCVTDANSWISNQKTKQKQQVLFNCPETFIILYKSHGKRCFYCVNNGPLIDKLLFRAIAELFVLKVIRVIKHDYRKFDIYYQRLRVDLHIPTVNVPVVN